MRCARFYGKHDMRVEEVDDPTLGDRDVLIRVKACGVCGTDVHIYEGDQGAAEVTPPTILGHEFSGVIEQVGKDVTDFAPGDRVCIDPNHPCGHCEPCRDGIDHYCEHMVGYGTTVNGGFAELCAVDAQQVYRLGKNTSFEQGAMTEPVACCLHGIDMCHIHPGSSVVVLGGGMIGLLMVQLARLAGATHVALLEPVSSKRAVAERLGADIAIDNVQDDAAARLAEAGFGNVDVVIECVGKPATIEEAIRLAGHKATVMMFGLTKPDETITVKPFEIFQKELVLTSSYINPYTQRRALDLINTGRIDVTSMVCAVKGLEDLPDILGKPELRSLGKYIISPTA